MVKSNSPTPKYPAKPGVRMPMIPMKPGKEPDADDKKKKKNK